MDCDGLFIIESRPFLQKLNFLYCAGFPRLLESPGLFSLKFQDLESPGKISWKVTYFLLVLMENKQCI